MMCLTSSLTVWRKPNIKVSCLKKGCHKNVDIKFSATTCFWNNHQVAKNRKSGKPTIIKVVGSNTTKGHKQHS